MSLLAAFLIDGIPTIDVPVYSLLIRINLTVLPIAFMYIIIEILQVPKIKSSFAVISKKNRYCSDSSL
jgi:hypothetical protein